MSLIRRASVSSALILALGGCATGGAALSIEGSLPPPAGYIYATGHGAAPPDLTAMIDARLKERGFADGGQERRYLVQIALASQPAGSGQFVPTEGKWLRPPTRATTVHLGLTITDLSDGKQVFRSTATRRTRRSQQSRLLLQLIEDIFESDQDPAV